MDSNKDHQAIPKISIGMPVYNGEKYLREALDSLLMQTFSGFEIIISDNHSTDQTGEICSEYAAKDSRIRYFHQTENLGAINNFTFVFEQSTGEYFMWAAADDKWERVWLEKMFEAVEGEKESFSFGVLQFIDEKGCELNHLGNGRLFPFCSANKYLRTLSYFLYPEMSAKANLILGFFPRIMMKSIINRGFLNFEYADIIFIHRVIQNFRLIQSSDAVFNKRVHKGNAGGALFAGQNPVIRMIKVSVEIFLKLPIQYIKETDSNALRVAMVLTMPVKWMLFIFTALLRRMRY